MNSQLPAGMEALLARPPEEQPELEHVEWIVDLPLSLPMVHRTFGARLNLLDPQADARIDSSFRGPNIFQMDMLVTAISVEASAEPECFVVPGRIGSNAALLAYGGPAWNALLEIMAGYEFQIIVGQRFFLIREDARHMTHLRPWSCQVHEDCRAHPEVGLACLQGGHEIPVRMRVRDTNHLLTSRALPSFAADPAALDVARAQPIDFSCAQRDNPRFRKLGHAFFAPAGYPITVQFEENRTDAARRLQRWLEPTGGRGGAVDGLEDVVLPAGRFSLRVGLRGLEVPPHWREAVLQHPMIRAQIEARH